MLRLGGAGFGACMWGLGIGVKTGLGARHRRHEARSCWRWGGEGEGYFDFMICFFFLFLVSGMSFPFFWFFWIEVREGMEGCGDAVMREGEVINWVEDDVFGVSGWRDGDEEGEIVCEGY